MDITATREEIGERKKIRNTQSTSHHTRELLYQAIYIKRALTSRVYRNSSSGANFKNYLAIAEGDAVSIRADSLAINA